MIPLVDTPIFDGLLDEYPELNYRFLLAISRETRTHILKDTNA